MAPCRHDADVRCQDLSSGSLPGSSTSTIPTSMRSSTRGTVPATSISSMQTCLVTRKRR